MKEITIKLDEVQSKLLDELESLHKSVFRREISGKDLVTMAFKIGLQRDLVTLRRTRSLLNRMSGPR